MDRANCFGNEVRPIEEIPHPYQQIFADYSGFNVIQSKVIDDALYTDNSLVVSAPTGSGKTVIFELAIVRLLISQERQFSQPFKIVYISPMKALCEERLVDWHKKLFNFGINSISVTGDSENIEFQNLLNHNLIITTPEKWDCLTRKWRENLNLVKSVKLFMIDEVHLLNEEERGSSLETIVCRMKTIEESIDSEETDCSNHKIRFVAVSAAVPNTEDVAEWINKSAKCHKFSDGYRPVKLKKIVLGYPQQPNQTPFKFDLSLNYKLQSLIMEYSHGKPTLIFCGTRKIVEMTAKHILQHLTINFNPEQKRQLAEAVSDIPDANIKETLVHGIGYHHAGILPQTRKIIENLFRNGELPVLVTTSTLAMGVNLPAHLVIVKSTKCYTNGGFRDYSETALLQMIGRAGRPQYDTEATALILTSTKDKQKFEKMIGGLEPIESDLHKNLIVHLNAEVVLQTITDLEVAMRWLSSTFLYVRARKNPRYYGLTSSDPSSIDRRLLEMCQIGLNKLIKAGMLTIDQDVLLKATTVGSLMAKYYLAFETMKLFTEISGGEILQQILALISKCHEFSEIYLRVNDKKCLNLLNKCRNRQTIRFPLQGKIKTVDMKINCIIQAVLGCLDICDYSLLTETLRIMRNGERIVKCLIEYLETKDKCYKALLNTIILAKCFQVKLWEDSPYVSKQLPGIGNVMSSQLANAGKTTFRLIAECGAREIELLINKKPPAGSKLLDQIHHLPKYELKLEAYGKNKIKLTISLQNASDLERTCTANSNSLMYLLVGDASNNILLHEKYSHSFLIENPDVVKFIDCQESKIEEIEANFISEDWVGIDCVTKLESLSKIKKGKEKTTKIARKIQNDDLTYMQTFMEMYMKCKKNKEEQKVNEIRDDENVSGNELTRNMQKDFDDENKKRKIVISQNIVILPSQNDKKSELKTVTCANQDLSEDDFFSTFKNKESHTHSSSKQVACLQNNEDYPASNSNKSTDSSSVISKFRYRPNKQLTQKRSFQSETSEKSINKIQHVEDKSKSQMKITWRSPLTYSPPVKFSPKISHNPLNSSCAELECLSTSRGSSSSLNQSQKVSRLLNRTLGSLPKTPLRLNTSQSKVIFPLSDKAYADSSLEESMEKNDDILEKVGDVVSTSFLESFGLIGPQDQKVLSQIKTPNEYYRQLLSQPQVKESDKQKKQEVSTTRREEEKWKKGKDDATRKSFCNKGQTEITSSNGRSNLEKSLSGDGFPRRESHISTNRISSKNSNVLNRSRFFTQNNKIPVDKRQRNTENPFVSSSQVNLRKLNTVRKIEGSRDCHFQNLSQFDLSEYCGSLNREDTYDGFDDDYSNQSIRFPYLEQGSNSVNNTIVRHSSESLKHIEKRSEDPFNDSFESVLKEYQIPSQVMNADQNITVLNRRRTSFVDLENRKSLLGTVDKRERPPSCSDNNYQRSLQMYLDDYDRSNIERSNSDFLMKDQIHINNPKNFDFACLDQTRSGFDEVQYNTQNRRYPLLPKPETCMPPDNLNCSMATNFRREGYNPYFSNTFDGYSSERPNQNFQYNNNLNRSIHDFDNNAFRSGFDSSEGYRYLRSVMENEETPAVNANYRRFATNVAEGRRIYDRNLSLPDNHFDNNGFDLSRSYSKEYGQFNQQPYNIERNDIFNPHVNCATPYSQSQRRQYCAPYHPYSVSPIDKNYIMHKFINSVDKVEENPRRFYN